MKANGIRILDKDWTDTLFRLIRNLSSYELSITVLITAEIIALTYYESLRRSTECDVLNHICKKIIEEERNHVLYESMLLKCFHGDKPRIIQSFVYFVHKCLFMCTVILVALDHKSVISRGGYTFQEFCRRNLEVFDNLF